MIRILLHLFVGFPRNARDNASIVKGHWWSTERLLLDYV